MKYTFTLLILFVGIATLSAQKDFIKEGEGISTEKLRPFTYRSGEGLVMDTLFPPIFAEDCSETVFSFGVNNGWGYVAGTNNFEDQEKAQKFSLEDNVMFSVIEIGVYFFESVVVGDGNLRAKIYSVDENTGGPGDLLGTSNDLKASEILFDEEQLLITIFDFESPPTGNGEAFFVSVDFSDLYESNDTVGILHSDVDCGSGEDAWELFNGQWARMFDSWGDLESDLFMAAVVDIQESTSTEDINEYVSINTFPSPARDMVNIEYTLKESSPVNIEMYGLDGRRVSMLPQGRQFPGAHKMQIDVAEWVNGTYLTRIVTERGVVTRKVVVMH